MAQAPTKHHNPLTETTVFAPEGMPVKEHTHEAIGKAPVSRMAPQEKLDLMMTDYTQDEMTAGKKAAEYYSQRRQAEIDYGKRFASRRLAKMQEEHK